MKRIKPVTWGILGTAFIAEKEIIPALLASPVSSLLAVASRSREKAKNLASNAGIPRSYGNYDELLADGNIEAVYIPLPNHLHAQYAVKALEAGKHVLVEKPAVISLEELDMVYNASIKKGLVFSEAFMFRYHDGIKQLQDYIKGQNFGKIRNISVELWINLKAQPGNIRLLDLPGSGAIFDLGTYTLAFIRILSNSEPEKIDGYAVYKKGTIKTDVAFSVSMIMRNGSLCNMQGGFISSRKAQDVLCPATLLFDKAEIQIPNFLSNMETYRCIIRMDNYEKVLYFHTGNYYQHEIDDFAAAVRREPSNLASKEDIAMHLNSLFSLADLCFKNKTNNGSNYDFKV